MSEIVLGAGLLALGIVAVVAMVAIVFGRGFKGTIEESGVTMEVKPDRKPR